MFAMWSQGPTELSEWVRQWLSSYFIRGSGTFLWPFWFFKGCSYCSKSLFVTKIVTRRSAFIDLLTRNTPVTVESLVETGCKSGLREVTKWSKVVAGEGHKLRCDCFLLDLIDNMLIYN